MNPAHVHLLLNHIPVIGIPLATFLLFYGIVRRNEEIKKTANIAFVLLAVMAVPSYLSGEPAEDVIENFADVSEIYIGQHENAASLAMVGTGILGGLAVIGLFVFRAPKNLPRLGLGMVLFIALMTTVLMARTAYLGGQIRHTELRSDSSTTLKNNETELKNEKDDD